MRLEPRLLRFLYVCYKLDLADSVSAEAAKEYHRHFNASRLNKLAGESVHLFNDGGNIEIHKWEMERRGVRS